MTKNELKTGYIVQYKNRKIRLVIKDWDGEDFLFGAKGQRWSRLDGWNDDLTHKNFETLDIVRVFRHDLQEQGTNIDTVFASNLIWAREGYEDIDTEDDVIESIIIAYEDVAD